MKPDENGHDPEALEISDTEQEKTAGALEHTVEARVGALTHATGCDAGWIDPAEIYIINGDEHL